MTPTTIVKHLDVFEQRLPRRLPRRVIVMMRQLPFQRAEEALHYGVVVAIARAAHAGRQAVAGQQLLILIARVLHPAIAVVQQALGWRAVLQRHPQSSAAEIGPQTVAARPTND